MSDFFGGVLDSLRGLSDDVGSFFDDALSIVGLSGSDVMKAANKALTSDSVGNTPIGKSSMPDTGVMSTLNKVNFQASKSDAVKSVDPKQVEAEWIQRMQQFIQSTK